MIPKKQLHDSGVIMHYCKFKTFNVGAGNCITLFLKSGDRVIKNALNKIITFRTPVQIIKVH